MTLFHCVECAVLRMRLGGLEFYFLVHLQTSTPDVGMGVFGQCTSGLWQV